MDQLDTDKPFESLLQKWARTQTTLVRDDAQNLVQQIIREAAKTERPHSKKHHEWNRTIAWSATIGIVAPSALFVFLRNIPTQKDSHVALMQAAALPINHVTKLMIESKTLFENHISWIADANRELLLGIDNSRSANEFEHSTVVIHVVVFRRAVGSTHWNTTWKTSIVLRNDEPVQIEMPQDQSQLRLWAHILPDRKVAVDSDYRRDSQPASNWRSATIPLATNPEMVLSNVDGEGEIQVWQSAMVMGEGTL